MAEESLVTQIADELLLICGFLLVGPWTETVGPDIAPLRGMGMAAQYLTEALPNISHVMTSLCLERCGWREEWN